MADSEDDILKEAIAGTELEIFSEAVGKDLPSTEGGPGDRSVEEMGEGLEGQHEPDEPTSEVEAKGEGEDDDKVVDDDADKGDGKTGQAKDPVTGQFVKKAETEGAEKTGKGDEPDADLIEADGKPKQRVPVSELIAERKARRAAEDRLKELETAPKVVPTDEIDRLVNKRIAEVLGQNKTAPTQETSTEAPKIDIFENPEAWIAATKAEIEKTVTQKYVAGDLQRTAEASPEKFEAAYKALTSLDKNDPQARATVQRIWNSATPGADLLRWYGRQEVQRVVGDDPVAYAEKIKAEAREALAKDPEFRKQLLATLQQEARTGEGGAPRHVARMPKSLNGAAGGQSPGGGGGPMDGSDKGVFESAFQS